MKLLAIVPSMYDTSPGQRFRLEQWEPLLKESGVEITYSPFETPELKNIIYKEGHSLEKIKAVWRSMKSRQREMQNLGQFDLVYVFREAALLGPAWFERKIAASGVPMIFDFDDAIFLTYKSPSNGYLSYLKFPAKAGTTIKHSAHVMAGNPYLENYARKFNNNVTIIPTTIDTIKYSLEEDTVTPETLTIGWSGSHSTVQHLDTVREHLQELAKSAQFRLRVIGTSEYKLDGVDVEAMNWRSESEIEDLRKIDIGIMPLPDDNWSEGKCGLKALQYMALGIPTICSPVGVNSTIIQDGVNGYLADGRSEWIEKLKMLISSSELRKSIGKAGRKTVEEKYSAISQVPRVLEVFQSAVGQKQK